MKKYESTLENFDTVLWGHHFKVPREIAESFIGSNERRVICTINDTLTIPCALMHNGDGNYFINMNKENRKKLHLSLGDKLTYQLVADDSKYGIPMPEEMDELLKIDDEASEYFHALTPGKQRSLLYQIGKPKSSATRLNKALGITEFLKVNRGALDFKLLNEFMKEFNKL